MGAARINEKMRVYHRYLGFFLAGIMAVYAISGIVLIFRDTDFLKREKITEKDVKPGLKNDELGRELRIRDLKVTREEAGILTFEQGTYNSQTGKAVYKVKELPFVIDKLTHLHKANTKNPLFYLNVFFGVSLLFFVISSFYMFLPGTSVFKKGLYFALAGVVLTVVMLFF